MIPEIKPFNLFDTNGFLVLFHGEFCIHQLCFPNLTNITITSRPEQQVIELKANCTYFKASHRLVFRANDTITLKISKYFERFEGKLSASVNFFNQLRPIDIHFDEFSYRYELPIEFPGGLIFNVEGTGDILRTTWKSLVKRISGETTEVQTFNQYTENIFLDVSNFTGERIELLRRRYTSTNEKYDNILEELNTIQLQANEASIEYQKSQSQYNHLLTNIERERERYLSFLKTNESLFLVDKDVSGICKTQKCEATCIPMFVCDICQEKVKVPSKVWKCSNYVEKIRTSQMVEILQTCQKTEYEFETVYTGNHFISEMTMWDKNVYSCLNLLS